MRSTRSTWAKALRLRSPMLLALATAAFAPACAENPESTVGDGDSSSEPSGSNNPSGGNNNPTPEPTALDDRKLDYNEALRTASLKLIRELPTLEQIKRVEGASDKKAAYETELAAMFADVRFQERMIKWWRDVMAQGGGADGDRPSRETAPVFAARITAEGRPYTDLFTATAGTCPTYNGDTRSFVDGDCNNGVPAHAGVLTDPGVQYQFYGNMAFRRVRWVQEIFVCTKFPAEYSDTPVQKGGADYVSPWKFESVGTTPIDFQDTSSVICANCHSTMNHIAPLFANFDDRGVWRSSIQVMTPVTPDPVTTQLDHWLAPGEQLSWRLGTPVESLTDLGQAIAADPDVAECAVARAWNFAMSKEDIVNDLSTVPIEVIQPFITEFKKNQMNFKKVLESMFTSDDFVRF